MSSIQIPTEPAATPSLVRTWIMASRPKTLPAAIIPVLVGTAVAIAYGQFSPIPALAALIAACLIQIGTNFANDYFDFKKGADTDDRLGPTRVTQAGLIAPEQVKWATALTFATAALIGIYLIVIGGWPILAIGIASILSGIAYTGGPYPLGYNGLGDVFVFIFFGIIAVTGTFYVQALTWSAPALAASIPVGLLATAILVVNNYRDIDTDIVAGKRTLATRIGRPATRAQYWIMLMGAYLTPILQVVVSGNHPWILLPLLSLPLAIVRARSISHKTGRELNALLGQTGQLLMIFGILYAIGITLAGSPT